MVDRLNSLRVWLLIAMLCTAVITILAGNFVIDRLNAASEMEADRMKALRTARAIAARLDHGVPVRDLQVLQRSLPNDQLVVIENGTIVFAGPSRASFPLEVTVSAPFADGKVVLRDHHAPGTGGVAQVTLVAGVIAALIIGEAWLGATVLMRTVRRPLRRAIDTADRVAAGDLSARMGEPGPEEFAHLGRALDSMAAKLQRSDVDQRQFLADLAHEIATPLSAVSGFALALADGCAQTDGERAEAADTVVQESERLQRLLEDVRTLNGLELAQSVRREPVDVAETCIKAVQRFSLQAQRAGVSLRMEAKQASAVADRRLIEAVVNNLLSNAIRYSPRGGSVELRVRKRREDVNVAVRDSGIGIAPEHRARIFDRLYRVDEARARATGGSGLGLAIARKAAHSLGGRIELDSRLGAGSEFRFIFPCHPEAAGQPSPQNMVPRGARA